MGVAKANKNNLLQLNQTPLRIKPVVQPLETTAAVIYFCQRTPNTRPKKRKWKVSVKRLGEAALTQMCSFMFSFFGPPHDFSSNVSIWRYKFSSMLSITSAKRGGTSFRVKHIFLFRLYLLHTLIKSRMEQEWFLFPTRVLYLRHWKRMSKSCLYPDKVILSSHMSLKWNASLQSNFSLTVASQQHFIATYPRVLIERFE